MSRKKILLCTDQTGGVASLRQLTRYCFGESNHRLVSLRVKSKALPKGSRRMTLPLPHPHSTSTRLLPKRKTFREYEATLKDIRREAQFSDLLLIEDTAYQFLFVQNESYPSSSSPRLACPIFVVPDSAERIEQIMLIDDGEPATYQRIKYLAYLFSSLCSTTPTTLLMAREQEGYVAARDEKLWINYLKLHFAHLAVHRVEERFFHTLPTMVDYTKGALTVLPASPLPPQLSNVLAPLTQFRLIL